MLSMPQKSRSCSTLTQKNEEKYQRNKEKTEKKSRGLPPPSVLSSLFFSITARQGSNKDSNVFGKTRAGPGHFFLTHTCIHTVALQSQQNMQKYQKHRRQ